MKRNTAERKGVTNETEYGRKERTRGKIKDYEYQKN